MDNFWTLVGFEYKKIIKRKSFVVAIIIMLFMSIFCMVADVLMSTTYENGEFMNGFKFEKSEREVQHKVAGYIDDKMLSDVVLKNVEAKNYIDENGSFEDSIYYNNIRPYNALRSSLARVLSPIQAFDFESFNSLESAEGIDFYKLRTKALEDKLTLEGYSKKELQQTLNLNSELKTPFYRDYYSGYQKFLIMMSTSAVFILLALCICIAPIFADEFQKKTDAVILSAKYGKSKLITAKIFTVISFSLLFITVALIIALVTTFLVYSTTGGDVGIQVWKLFSVYPLTMAKAVMLYCLVIVCVALLISAVCLALSARLSAFSTIITLMLLLVGGIFFRIPFESLRAINYFLPAKMVDSMYVFSDSLVAVFGMYLKPYLFIPIICFAMLAVLLPIAYKSFKNHQVV